MNETNKTDIKLSQHKVDISNITCPRCKKGLLVRNLSASGVYWWGCTNYKNGCRAMYYDKNGKPKI